MESLQSGTTQLTDAAFVEAIESCLLPASQFHHADHIRLAWIYLGQMSQAEAELLIEQAIRRFAAHNGVSQKYHHTITLAWMRLVAAARRATPTAMTFPEFANLHPQLLCVSELKQFYSQERLASPEARTGWLAPDLTDLP